MPEAIISNSKSDGDGGEQAQDKVRLTIRMNKSLYERVIDLVDRTGAYNAPDVVRNALVLYDTLVTECENGKEVVVIDSEGEKSKYPIFMRR